MLFWGQVQFLWYDITMDDEIKLSDERLSFEHSYFQLPSCHGHNRLEYVMKFTSYTSQPFKMTYMCCGTASGYEVNSYHLSFCWNKKKKNKEKKNKKKLILFKDKGKYRIWATTMLFQIVQNRNVNKWNSVTTYHQYDFLGSTIHIHMPLTPQKFVQLSFGITDDI